MKNALSTQHLLLSNGLSVVMNRSDAFYSVEAALYVKSGPMWERPEISGISHLLEHMLLKGPRSFPSSHSFHQALEQNGILVDAVTKEEHTFFSFECHPDDLVPCLELMAGMISAPGMKEDDLENEKRIIREEYYTFEEENRLGNEMFKLLFRKQWHHFNLIGQLGTVRGIDIQKLKSYYKQNYCARDMVLCITGNFNSRKTKNTIKKWWHRIPSGKRKKLPRIQTAETPCSRLMEKSGIPQIEFDFGFPTCSWRDARPYAVLRFLSRILGESVSSRLFTEIREKAGLAYDIGSSLYSMSVQSVFDIRGTTAPENLFLIFSLIEDILRNLSEKGPNRMEVEMARKSILNAYLFSNNSISAQNDYFGTRLLLDTRKERPNMREDIKIFKAITAEEIRAAAGKTFKNRNVVFTAIGKIKQNQKRLIRNRVNTFLKP